MLCKLYISKSLKDHNSGHPATAYSGAGCCYPLFITIYLH